jgi:hypothetical protein
MTIRSARGDTVKMYSKYLPYSFGTVIKKFDFSDLCVLSAGPKIVGSETSPHQCWALIRVCSINSDFIFKYKIKHVP